MTSDDRSPLTRPPLPAPPEREREADRPAFGPSGYLPERAARRARKIVLRAPMGIGWPLAAVAMSVVVLTLGTLAVVRGSGPPEEPWRAVAPLGSVDPRGLAEVTVDGSDVLLVRGGGGLGAFLAPGGTLTWCPSSGRIEAADGRVWTADGRLVGGSGASLAPRGVQVHAETVFVDPSAGPPTPPVSERGERPRCA